MLVYYTNLQYTNFLDLLLQVLLAVPANFADTKRIASLFGFQGSSLAWLNYTTSDVVCQHFFVIF